MKETGDPKEPHWYLWRPEGKGRVHRANGGESGPEV